MARDTAGAGRRDRGIDRQCKSDDHNGYNSGEVPPTNCQTAGVEPLGRGYLVHS